MNALLLPGGLGSHSCADKSPVFPQKYDPDLFRMALPCLSAIAGALPPDYLDTRISATLEKQLSVDADGNFDPKPISTLK